MICLLTGDTHFGHLVKMMSTISTITFLNYNVTLFPFVISKDFVGWYLKVCKFPVSHQMFGSFISFF